MHGWICEHCGVGNGALARGCRSCGSQRPGIAPETPPPPESGDHPGQADPATDPSVHQPAGETGADPLLAEVERPPERPIPAAEVAEPARGPGRRRGVVALVLSLAAVIAIGAIALVGLRPDATAAPLAPLTAAAAPTEPLPSIRAASPTLAPSPSPRPSDRPLEHPVIGRLLDRVADPALSGRWETSMRLTAGDWKAETMRFEVARSGQDGWTRLWALQPSGDLEPVHESAQLDGRSYARDPDEPWTEDPPDADLEPPVALLIDRSDTLTYEGRVRRGGERLHRIGLPRYGSDAGRGFVDALAARLGTVEGTQAWILVRSDGTPVVLVARIEGTIDGGTPTVATMTTVYRDIGDVVPISLGGMPPPRP
jgi:hypothetical protein